MNVSLRRRAAHSVWSIARRRWDYPPLLNSTITASLICSGSDGQRVFPAIPYQPSHCGQRESRPIGCVTQNKLDSVPLSVPPWRLFTNHAYFYHEIFCHGNSNSIPDGVIVIGAGRVRRCLHRVAIL